VTRDPVSWLVVERGWDVVASDGAEIGRVDEVVGDANADIFNGLSVSAGLLRPARYVPAELVRSIAQERIELAVTSDEFARLDEFEGVPPAST
jgi:uncharacterized protein YrrD